MLFIRNFGQFLNGNSTSFQVVASGILGALIGFIPIPEGAVFFVPLAGLLLVIQAPLLWVGIFALVAQLAALLTDPAIAQFGEILVQGPAEPIVQVLIESPVTAWMGFEYYRMVGGIPTAIFFGLFAGIALAVALRRFRQWASKAENAERLQRSSWQAPLSRFVFGGKIDAADFQQSLEDKRWRPIRWAGLAIVVLAVAAGAWAIRYPHSSLLTSLSQQALVHMNRATVDLDHMEFDWNQGALSLVGLQIADPNALSENLLQLGELNLDLDADALLRRQFTVDRVVISGFAVGLDRGIPGEPMGEAFPLPEVSFESVEEFMAVLETYVADIELWQDRLEVAKRWYRRAEYVRQRIEALDPRSPIQNEIEKRRSGERVKRARAEHLLEARPAFTIREIFIDGIQLDGFTHELFRLEISGLSDRPDLSDTALGITLFNEADSMGLRASFPEWSAKAMGSNQVQVFYDYLPIDWVAEQWNQPELFPLKGGYLSIELNGGFNWKALDLPLSVRLEDTTLLVPQVGEIAIADFQSAGLLRLVGSPQSPRFSVDQSAIRQSISTFAQQALAEVARKEARSFLGEATLAEFAALFKGTGLENAITWVEEAELDPTLTWFDGNWEFPPQLTGIRLNLGHESCEFVDAEQGFYIWGRNRDPIRYHYHSDGHTMQLEFEYNGAVESYELTQIGGRQTYRYTHRSNGSTWEASGEFEASGNTLTLFAW